MARFKRLSIDELNVLEAHFIQYLAAQGITADDWTRIQSQDAEAVDKHVDAFSDLVYGSVLRDAKFLEHRDKHSVSCFQLLDDKAVVVRLEVQTDSADIDLRNSDTLGKLANGSLENRTHVYTTDKPWTSTREDEIFSLMENGCVITDGHLFKVLCSLL